MMKKYFLISILIIFGFTQFSYSAGKAKIISEDISDLIVKGFEVFDVSVTEKKIFYSLRMIKMDSKLVNYPPIIMCVVSLNELTTGCFDIN
jgi:hypothetical protein